MTRDSAESMVTGSALVVGMVYAFRHFYEGAQAGAAPHIGTKHAAKQLAGQGSLPPVSHFIIGYGFVYFVLSLLAQGAPQVGGSMAVLVGAAAVLTQGQALSADVSGMLGAAPSTSGALSTASPNQSASFASVAVGQPANVAAGAVGQGILGLTNNVVANPNVNAWTGNVVSSNSPRAGGAN